MKSIRTLLFIIIIAIISTTIFSYVFLNNNFFLRKWNIPANPPGFYDSRQFAWAAESYASGHDPLRDNPANPTGQPLNYPKIWQLLFVLGMNESDTNTLGTIVVVLFLMGVGAFWFSRNYSNLAYGILCLLFLSPAVMLGVERSNIELVLFFLLSLALTINYYSRIPALFVFEFAAVLKLYPVFGLLYLLNESKRRFLTLFLIASGLFIIYILLTFGDIKQIILTTPKAVPSAFGINVWWMGLQHRRIFNLSLPDNSVQLFKTFSYVLAFLIVSVTLYLSMHRQNNGLFREGQYMDAFRVGAGIYIGCFLLMNTIDYRLIFLAFTIPQIVEWLRDDRKGISSVPFITLAAMVFSAWNFFVVRFLGRKLTFVMEEFCNWVVLACLLYLFFSSVPDWFREYLRRPLSKIKLLDKRKTIR